MSQPIYADSMAFAGLQGQPPDFAKVGRPELTLAHLTGAPPMVHRFNELQMLLINFRDAALRNPDTRFVGSRRDLPEQGTPMGLVFGLQRAPDALSRKQVIWLATEGVRIMALAYDGETEYGGGFKTCEGLTNRGRDLIGWMAERGILLDLSHANTETALDALAFIAEERVGTVPLLSHSGCAEVYSHPRNASDDVLCGVASIGGYIGVPAITFLTGPQDCEYLDQFAAHMKYATETFGEDLVGIGSDCNHCTMTMTDARRHFENMVRMLKSGGSFGEYFPDRPPELVEHGDRMFQILSGALRANGISRQTADNVCGSNFIEYLRRALR